MLRFALRRTPGAALATSSAVGAKAYYCAAPEGDAKALNREKLEIAVRNKMKQYWNDGNLFALSAASLEKYLEMEGVAFREKSAKAVLIRLCEQTLAFQEAKAQGKVPEGDKKEGGDTAEHGEWDKPLASSKTKFLDVAQRDFYRSAVEYAPRAFQVMPENSGPDLYVARVNTTAFPGFPSSSECYTLTPAESADSNRIRYTKTLMWGIMNLRNLKSKGELTVDLGKFFMSETVLNKPSEEVVPYWDLQQRLHAKKPHIWVSAASPNASADVAKVLTDKGFQAAGDNTSFDVVVKRAKDSLHATVAADSSVTKVAKVRAPLQATHIIREEGPDMRICLRNQEPLQGDRLEEATKSFTFDAKSKSFAVAPEAGSISYSSENVEKSWTKTYQEGLVHVKVVQRSRKPITTTKDEDAGDRTEFQIVVEVPEAESNANLNLLAADLLELGQEVSKAATPSFVSDFGCQME